MSETMTFTCSVPDCDKDVQAMTIISFAMRNLTREEELVVAAWFNARHGKWKSKATEETK